MPADANSYERDLARSVDAVGELCDVCYGRGGRISPTIGYIPCVYCKGTGYVDHDAMDDADSAYERAGDR
jgi:hypothetical protein